MCSSGVKPNLPQPFSPTLVTKIGVGPVSTMLYVLSFHNKNITHVFGNLFVIQNSIIECE